MHLPVPPEIAELESTRPSLFETVVLWLYSTHNPATFALAAPRFAEDDDYDGLWDFDRPLDMDATCPDELIMAQIVQSVKEEVYWLRELCPNNPTYAWPT